MIIEFINFFLGVEVVNFEILTNALSFWLVLLDIFSYEIQS